MKGPDGGEYRRNRVHMRPTKVVRNTRHTSPVVISRTPDHPSTLPLPKVQIYTLPTDSEMRESQVLKKRLLQLRVVDNH